MRACAVLHAYSPQAVAGAMAAAMGAAGVASGAAIATTADGKQVSALAEAVTGTMDWGRREQRRYLAMPARVLVVVTATGVIVHEWTVAQGVGRKVASWPRGTFVATRVKYAGQIGVRVVVDSGQAAIMTGRRGRLHPNVRATVDAIVAAGPL